MASKDLVRLFQRVFANGIEGLLAVPRAPAGRAQPRHDRCGLLKEGRRPRRIHCRNCGRTLTWCENVPLLSWLALRGRCRTCKEKISWRYPLVELLVGLLWASAFDHFFGSNIFNVGPIAIADDFTIILSRMLLYWLLVALAVLDAEHLWLPNWLTIPGVIAGFLINLLEFKLSSIDVLAYYGATQMQGRLLLRFAERSVLAILAPAALILLIRWTYKLIRHREGIGLGDAKLMAMLGAWLGLPGALLSFAIGVILGAMVALVLLATPKSQRGTQTWALTKLPLGTFLCIGGIVSALWGQPILAAYMRYAGW
jgi:leader peptidase (prepilin peptidase)/N-methyltransferase